MKNRTKEYNKALCKKYPFLIPRNVYTGDIHKDFDHSYTVLDDMPDGWRIAFGEQFCQELQEALERSGHADEYMVLQCKEKFGGLRWYSNWDTDEMSHIISKYMKLSERTCIKCGKPATRITKGWIYPYCDDCCPNKPYWTLEDYFKPEDGEET